MVHINKTWIAAFFAALLFLGVQACTDSNFAGGAAGKSAGLTGKNKGKDGADSGGPDSGGPDSGEPDSGGPDSSDGPDGGGVDAADSGGPDGGGLDESDTSDTGGPGGDDGEVSAKTRHDATIERIAVNGDTDNPFTVKVETIVKGKTTSTQTVSFEEDEIATKNLKLACRNSKNTCFKVTFINDANDRNGHIEVVGGTPNEPVTCVWAHEEGKSATIDIDADGDEHSGILDLGTCKEGEDDRVKITCPQSNKLQVQLCTGG